MSENQTIVLERIENAKVQKSLSLDLSGLSIRDLPSQLGELTWLLELNLSFNNLTILPSCINRLNSLRHLDLSYNCLNQNNGIGFEYPCYLPLVFLNLSFNNFSKIPSDIHYPYFIENVLLDGNEVLEGLPEFILDLGYKTIDYFHSELLASKNDERIFEAKMLFVGQGEVGKTTLMKKLVDSEFQVEVGMEPTTHGINIMQWKVEIPLPEDKVVGFDEYDEYFEYGNSDYDENNSSDYDRNQDEGEIELWNIKLLQNENDILQDATINIWDFGGQEIYYSTHQFFLTKRSIYIFVWDARKEEDNRGFEYWFNTINVLGESSPVLIVQNKLDVRIKEIDQKLYKEKFPNIIGFFQVSCSKNVGLDELRFRIFQAFKGLPHLKDRLPKTWISIRENLIELNKNYIDVQEYQKICLRYGVAIKRIDLLSDYLHDLGYMLHFWKDEILKNIIILKPEWTTNAFYKLVDSNIIRNSYGEFSLNKLEHIWDSSEYPSSKHLELLKLMERFEICFNVLSTYNYIIPELLRASSHFDIKDFEKDAELKFEYRFKFMPSGLIPRFICRNSLYIDQNLFWKNGLLMNFEDSNALIIGDSLNRIIKIFIKGKFKESLLGIIRKEFGEIFSSLKFQKEEDFSEMIPCNCQTCINKSSPYFFKFSVLKMFQSKDKVFISCQESADDVEIVSLIRGYEKNRVKEMVIGHLLVACSQLQGNFKLIDKKEDTRNSFVSNILNNRGLLARDQARWGSSPTKKSQGEIDIRLEESSGMTLGIFEGLNLKHIDSHKIHSHIEKIFEYDPNGLESNYIIIYSDAVDFMGLWRKYPACAENANCNYDLIGSFEDISSNYQIGGQIKVGRTKYNINEKHSSLYHIFVNMNYGK